MTNISDVQWNHAAAGAASAALRRAAAMLRQTADERSKAAHRAMAEWRGGEREKFELRLRTLLDEAEQLAAKYLRAAALIERASERAREEQRRREYERE